MMMQVNAWIADALIIWRTLRASFAQRLDSEVISPA
jgi:hypothetical protein